MLESNPHSTLRCLTIFYRIINNEHLYSKH
nr:MAG TPA: hypothetical protein [Caudoviricetes sp.]